MPTFSPRLHFGIHGQHLLDQRIQPPEEHRGSGPHAGGTGRSGRYACRPAGRAGNVDGWLRKCLARPRGHAQRLECGAIGPGIRFFVADNGGRHDDVHLMRKGHMRAKLGHIVVGVGDNGLLYPAFRSRCNAGRTSSNNSATSVGPLRPQAFLTRPYRRRALRTVISSVSSPALSWISMYFRRNCSRSASGRSE